MLEDRQAKLSSARAFAALRDKESDDQIRFYSVPKACVLPIVDPISKWPTIDVARETVKGRQPIEADADAALATEQGPAA